MTTMEIRERARGLAICVVAILFLGVITLWLPKRSVYKAKRELAAALYEQKEFFSEHQQKILRKASKSLLYAGKNIHIWAETGDSYETYIGGGIFWGLTKSIEDKDIHLPDHSWGQKECKAFHAVLDYQSKVGLWMLGILGILFRNLLVLSVIYQVYDWIDYALCIRRRAKKSEEEIAIA